MVVKEFFRQREDGVGLYKSYSDKEVYIRKIGTDEEYSEAIDIEGASYEYEETDRPIEKEEPLEEIEVNLDYYK
jgi:hypothetical protein